MRNESIGVSEICPKRVSLTPKEGELRGLVVGPGGSGVRAAKA